MTPPLNRRDFIALTTAAGVGLIAGGCGSNSSQTPNASIDSTIDPANLKILPYPQQITMAAGRLRIGAARYDTFSPRSKTIEVAIDSLERRLPPTKLTAIDVRLGSVAEGYRHQWLTPDEREFLAADGASDEACVLKTNQRGVTVVGKGAVGMLHGVQTINQLILQAHRENRNSIPCLTIRDWPDMRWRCLAPTLTWYSGFNRLEGYDICNWSEGEWKWLADWSLLHKCNAWAVCMYGYWPFSLPKYEKETLDVESDWFNPATNKREKHRFVHRNIRQDFYGRVIEYANERGVKVHAYIGKNSFNGHQRATTAPTAAGGAAELLPFGSGVEEYWDAMIGRILDIGFNGFVFEDPESNHVPNQNEECWKTFWEPWAAKYGYKSVKDTNQNAPPLGVHIEYYSWLFRTFDRLIQKHAKRLRREPEIYLISHFLLARIVNESKTVEERNKWLAMVDEKQGRKVPFIIVEDKEKAYVDMFGGERVASLGGRGGSCTCAMRRIASVNNDWSTGPFGADLAYERDCQKRIFEAGGFGAMGYIFEWTNTEVFAYIAAQHLWRNAGIPGVSNSNQVDILYHAYKLYYGDEVGELVAKAMDEGSCVNDAMVLENVNGSQWPSTGRALHRDYQLLAVLADHAEVIAREAYRRYAGKEPELYTATYDQDAFHWDGYDPTKDKLLKTERLRLLWISCRRSQEMCEAALAHRLAQRLIAENAPREKVLEQFDRAIEHAKLNQRIYQLNYDDDYDWTDGLCAKLTDELQSQRSKYLAAKKPKPVLPVLFIPWEKQADIVSRPMLDATTFVTDIGFAPGDDYFRLGVTFSLQYATDSTWQTLFRQTVHRRTKDWTQCTVTLPPARTLKLRLVTDSYSRAQDRNQPTWKWAAWRNPRVELRHDVLFDFSRQIDNAQPFVQLDSDGKLRPFDHPEEDSTGATFKKMPDGAIAAFTPHKDGKFGITIAEYEIQLG